MKKKVEAIIVDDHPVVLQGFAFMLADAVEVELVGQFETADEALSFMAERHPQLVFLDINLAGKNGIDACAEILQLYPACKVIAISNINEPSIIQRMLQAGATGYLLKNASKEEVLDSIHLVINGGTGISAAARQALSLLESGEMPVVTRREKEVLTLLASGCNTNDIAEKMFVSPLTVESHRRNLLQKFKVTNVAALIHQAMELKYIS
jgi:DNA-binding NarL/FixJ family response regulator